MKIVCWNIAHSRRSWDALVEMPDVDIALLQEASRLPEDLRHRIDVDYRLWPERHDAWLGYPSVVARLSDRVSARFITTRQIGGPYSHDFYTSEWGTLGAAVVTFKPIGKSPSGALGQLDYVFATDNIAVRVSARALNSSED